VAQVVILPHLFVVRIQVFVIRLAGPIFAVYTMFDASFLSAVHDGASWIRGFVESVASLTFPFHV
jgi:hypothetical protein